jgi:hypothetical protein
MCKPDRAVVEHADALRAAYADGDWMRFAALVAARVKATT